MSRCFVDASPWLHATVRRLLKRVDELEQKLPSSTFRWDSCVSDFYPQAPPGVHYSNLAADAVSENYDFACLFQDLYYNVAANNDAARPTFLSAEVFDNDDVPSTDNFLQNTIDADTTLDAANNDVARFEILSAEVFDSEDVPSAGLPLLRIAPTILSAEVFDYDDGPSTDNFFQCTIDAYETVRTDDVDKYEDDDYEDGDYDSDIYEGYNSDLFDDDDAVIQSHPYPDEFKDLCNALSSLVLKTYAFKMHDDGLVAPDMNPVDTLMRKRKKKKKKKKTKCNIDSEFEICRDSDDYAQLGEFYAMQHLGDEFDEFDEFELPQPCSVFGMMD